MDLTALTDTEARDLLAAVYADVQRRDTLANAPAQAEALAAIYAAAIGRKPGNPYQPVSGAHDAYAPGSIVSDGDAYYRATALASHAPGTTGAPWERVWPDGDDYGGLPVVLTEGSDGEPLDTTAPDGYETAEVSAAKTLVGDILGTDFGGYDNGDLDTLAAADRIINRLVAAGWRPTIADPYFVSEALLREIDRQRE